ncbi:RNA polymerase sigma factor [Sphingobium nicotianae]|uniref:Sigma-70 family RNA polymerase sigma factor n=1 Tax=Sphingobium nicotianae TaxID=2782607 RepID=A0A9X1D9W3_9SPHN|nr:sigma-70 family RNA polymerase sigma factor [Sphingobium nicotianae]MBT2186020.1 sigma-70 family RNA polymerase sigma factor [Sphingobium nicotianae]
MDGGRAPSRDEDLAAAELGERIAAPSHGSGDGIEALEPLRKSLVADYQSLLKRLTRSLRSPDAAQEALHDTYLKLETAVVVAPVRRPFAYLYRMALNLAKNRRRHETRFVQVEVAKLANVPDHDIDVEAVVADRQAVELAHSLLAGFTARQRTIFLARWRDGKTQVEIATLVGLHKRTVQKELKLIELFLHATVSKTGKISK